MKKAIIKFEKDYDGGLAWLIQESYDNVISDPFSRKVLRREYFDNLQEVVQDYLEKGFTVEIDNA